MWRLHISIAYGAVDTLTTMDKIASPARFFVAISMVAFAIQHFVHGEFVTRLAPKLPPWVPWHPFWAYLAGAVLIVAAAAIMAGRKARLAATMLGGIILFPALFLQLRLGISTPRNAVPCTNPDLLLA